MVCSKCGRDLADGTEFCVTCGEPTGADKATATAVPGGAAYPGSNAPMGGQQLNANGVPVEIAGKLNWGAFLLGPIWSIAHSTWIGLLCFVPYIGFVMSIVLLIKGNEWGWKNRQFGSVQEFNDVQRAWTKWGVVILILGIVLGMVVTFLSVMAGMGAVSKMPTSVTP